MIKHIKYSGLLLCASIVLGCQSTTLSSSTILNKKNICANYNGEIFNGDSLNFTKILDVEPLSPGFSIFEGIVWTNNGLTFSHIGLPSAKEPNPSHLMRYENGKLSILEEDYGSNGLTLNSAGKIVAARQLDGSVTELESKNKLATQFNGVRFNSPNDAVISSGGNLYFTDPDWSAPKPYPQTAERAYFRATDGSITSFGGNVTKPNGVMLSLDEKHLYLGGTNGLYKFKLAEDGSVIDKAQAISGIEQNVDGLSKDCAGNIVVTAHGQVVFLSPNDEIISSYKLEGVTNVAFGGEDGKTLFATTLGKRPGLFKLQSNVPGFPY